MKLLLGLLLLISCPCFADSDSRDVVSNTSKALRKTEPIKRAEKKLSSIGKNAIKQLPLGNHVSGIVSLALQPQLDYNLNNNNKIVVDYRDEKVYYQYKLEF